MSRYQFKHFCIWHNCFSATPTIHAIMKSRNSSIHFRTIEKYGVLLSVHNQHYMVYFQFTYLFHSTRPDRQRNTFERALARALRAKYSILKTYCHSIWFETAAHSKLQIYDNICIIIHYCYWLCVCMDVFLLLLQFSIEWSKFLDPTRIAKGNCYQMQRTQVMTVINKIILLPGMRCWWWHCVIHTLYTTMVKQKPLRKIVRVCVCVRLEVWLNGHSPKLIPLKRCASDWSDIYLSKLCKNPGKLGCVFGSLDSSQLQIRAKWVLSLRLQIAMETYPLRLPSPTNDMFMHDKPFLWYT